MLEDMEDDLRMPAKAAKARPSHSAAFPDDEDNNLEKQLEQLLEEAFLTDQAERADNELHQVLAEADVIQAEEDAEVAEAEEASAEHEP